MKGGASELPATTQSYRCRSTNLAGHPVLLRATFETSSTHLDTMRDLKQVNSLLATIAYPVLEQQGLLGRSRLRTASHLAGQSLKPLVS